MENMASSVTEMQVCKRDGKMEFVTFDKILGRIRSTAAEEPALENINVTDLTMKVIEQLYDGIATSQIDELTSEQCASLSTKHFDYGSLASRILVSNHHKNTSDCFSKVVENQYNFFDIAIWGLYQQSVYAFWDFICLDILQKNTYL